MPLRVSSVTIAALDPEVVAAFWCQVLGYAVVDRDGDAVVSIAGHGGPAIDVLRVGEAKTAQNRLHLDLRADVEGNEFCLLSATVAEAAGA